MTREGEGRRVAKTQKRKGGEPNTEPRRQAQPITQHPTCHTCNRRVRRTGDCVRLPCAVPCQNKRCAAQYVRRQC